MRKALVVGINEYPRNPLNSCVNDACKLDKILKKNGDGSPNFATKLIKDPAKTTRSCLRYDIDELFKGEPDIALFYFSGHGCINSYGGHIVTSDYQEYDEGISMDEILTKANRSKAKNKIIILDCCYSGTMGYSANDEDKHTSLANGVTILTACRRIETAVEIETGGVFTNLLLEALEGGCADLVGNISPGSIYAYIDRALGPWYQRPTFKTNVVTFISLRSVIPPIDINILRNITSYFDTTVSEHRLDPTYEDTQPNFNEERSKIFKELQIMVSVGLVKPVGEKYMYYAALHRKSCKLTELGKQYWKLVDNSKI